MSSFTFSHFLKIYQQYEKKHKDQTYKYLSKILNSAKSKHKKSLQGNDHEQSWRAFKGKNLEKLIVHIIKNQIENLGLKIINGNTLERTNENNLSTELANVKRNLLIDYGEYGYHLPDVDIVIYTPKTFKVIAVISSKVTLREGITQSVYWKLKLLSQSLTKHIKVYFITPDEDGTLRLKDPAKKGRAIVEMDLDGSYVLTENDIEESTRVKHFNHFISDLSKIVDNDTK